MQNMAQEAKTVKLDVVTPQCQFFVQRKKRLCRMTVKPGRQYCGEHEPQPKTDAGQVDTRIPCPNDPKHTCYASKLEKHLAICNARRTEQPAYIVENINAPEAVESHPRKPLSAIPKDDIIRLIDKINQLYAEHIEGQITEEPVQPIHRSVLPEFEEADRAESSRRHLRQASALLHIVERAGLVRDNTCYVELGAGKGQLSYYACHAWCARAGRVLAVDRAPLRHKRDNKLRSAPPTLTEPHDQPAAVTNSNEMETVETSPSHKRSTDSNYTEENSGVDEPSAKLSNVNAQDVGEARIEESNKEVHSEVSQNNGSDKSEGDGSRKTEDQSEIVKSVRTEVGADVAVRLRADLAHLALGAVPAVAASDAVVGIAKHLCGVATDYALRCVAAPGVVRKTRGAVLATCCHHRCERALYVASGELQELGINAEDFNIMLGIVSWATCGDGRSRERRQLSPLPRAPPRAEHPLPREGREEVGRRAKALLDWGRVLWLRARGFDARLCHYVPAQVSLENVCLVATKL